MLFACDIFLFDLNITCKLLEIYLIFDSGHTPSYYAGLHLFYLFTSGQKFRTDLKNLFITQKIMTNGNITSTLRTTIPVTSVS